MNFSPEIFAFVLCISLSYATENTEPNFYNYEYFPKIGIAYKFVRAALPWGEARKYCISQNATLAIPRNKEQHEIIMKIRNSNPAATVVGSPYPDWMYLGFHDFFVENQFQSNEGFTMDNYYQDFETGQPGQGTAENCGSVHINGRYHDYPCYLAACFMCQKEDKPYRNTLRSISQVNGDKRYKFNAASRKKYRVSSELLTWGSAQAICFAEGGNLAVIRNRQEMLFLADMLNSLPNLPKYAVYKNVASVGFHDHFIEDDFVSVTGEELYQYKYLRWAIGQPSGWTSENCVVIDTEGYLQDANCNVPNLYICEKEVIGYDPDLYKP